MKFVFRIGGSIKFLKILVEDSDSGGLGSITVMMNTYLLFYSDIVNFV